MSFQALVGLLLFNESLSLRWWFGSLLILLGLLLINRGNLKGEENKDGMVFSEYSGFLHQ
jgi:drug/metabolite transporter (DMT)-like permease